VNAMTDQFLTSKRDEGYWATIIFFMPLVLQRLFIGGVSGGYDSYSGYSFFWLGYVIHIGFISMLFLKRVKNNSNITYAVLFLFAISILQAYYISTIFTGYFLSIFVVLMRAIIWIGAMYAFSILYFDNNSFKKAFYEIIIAACIFILLCSIYFNLTGVPFGVNIEKGIGRVHGTFSEPSTLASVVPAFTIISLFMRKYLGFLIGILVIYGAASVVVTAVFFLCFIVYLFLKYNNFNKYFIYFIVIFAILMTLSLNAEVVNRLDYLSAGFSKFLDNSIGQSIFRAYTIDRIITSIHDLATSLNYATDLKLEDSGGLARLVGSITMLKNMELDGTTWFGYGLSVYGFVANALYGSALDFGLYPYFISSFGIIFGTVFILILTSTVLKWQNHDRVMFIIFSGGLLGTIYNSGGGITAYSVVMLAIFVQHAKTKKITSANPSERGDI
jgi:hypothetical protein